MRHHKLRFGLKGNIKVIICRIFGHRINNDPRYHWCERCGLAYEECYECGLDYWSLCGVVKDENVTTHNKDCAVTQSEIASPKSDKSDFTQS
jgi:hypothetical protein